MKYLLYLFIPLWSADFAFAQAVTIGHVSAPVEYYRMPDEPLDQSYSTYSVEVDMRTGELLRTGLSQAQLESEYLFLEGYRKVLERGDIHIEASIGDFNVYGERTGTQQTKHKDKDGKEFTKVQYYVELRYSLPMAIRVTDRKGKTLLDKYIYHMTDDQTWRSSNYSTLSDLDRYWRSNRSYKLGELQKERIRQGMKVISDLINNTYGYRRIKENERFEKIAKKKHPLYPGYNTAAENIKKAFTLMSADKGLEEVKKAVQPAIVFYQTADAQCEPSDKDGIKLKHIGLYNLGLIHFWLEDFEKSKTYTEKIYEFDDKDKDAKRLLEQIDYVAYSLRKANRKSRHIVVVGKT